MVKIEEEYIDRGLGPEKMWGARDKISLYTRTWIPDGVIKATVLFIHGLGEHCERYDRLFTEFAQHGFKTGSFDQRGFGKTQEKGGPKGVGSFDATLDDIKFLSLKLKIDGKPHFIMGHSMGGGLCLLFASLYPEGITGVIGSAPMIESGSFTTPNAVELFLLKNLAPIFPNLQLASKIDIKNISRDVNEINLYSSDKYVHGWGGIGLFRDILFRSGELLTKHAENFVLPVLVTHGALDTLTCPEASKKFVDLIPSKDKTHVVYPGFVHELHNEPEEDRKKVTKQYVDWIKARL